MTTVLIVLGVLLVMVLIYAATKPDTFRVTRSLTIQAPPERLFALIEDYRQWPAWSPYERLDSQMIKRFSGADRGVGAIYEWEGRKAGKGRITILNATPPLKLVMQLDMLTPIEGHNTVEFLLTPRSGGTEVSWVMHGRNRYLSKLMSLFFNMDRMVGGQFEEGLGQLKAAAEKA